MHTQSRSAAALVLLWSAFAAPASAQDAFPTPEQVVETFSDQFGVTTFEPSGISAWKEIEDWVRIDVVNVPPEGKEGVDQPTIAPAPLQKRIHLYERTKGDTTEYGLIEEIVGKPELSNPFPVFEGTPASFVFNNNATDMGEFQEH
jgi:hypothetical protein